MTQDVCIETPECLEHKISLTIRSGHIFTDGKYDPVYFFPTFYCKECNSYLSNGRMEKDIHKLAEEFLDNSHMFPKRPKITKVLID